MATDMNFLKHRLEMPGHAGIAAPMKFRDRWPVTASLLSLGQDLGAEVEEVSDLIAAGTMLDAHWPGKWYGESWVSNSNEVTNAVRRLKVRAGIGGAAV